MAFRTGAARLIGSMLVRTTRALAAIFFSCRYVKYICLFGEAIKTFCRTSFTIPITSRHGELEVLELGLSLLPIGSFQGQNCRAVFSLILTTFFDWPLSCSVNLIMR